MRSSHGDALRASFFGVALVATLPGCRPSDGRSSSVAPRVVEAQSDLHGGEPRSAVRSAETKPTGDARSGERPSIDRDRVSAQFADLQPGEEREVNGLTVKIHRIQATAPIGDGWHRGTSTDGMFSVELPLPFNDFSIGRPGDDRVHGRMHLVGAKSPGLLSWAASCGLPRDRTSAPVDRTEAKGTTAVQRTVDLDGLSCVLIVEAQGSDPLPPDADIERFLRSLEPSGTLRR